MIRSFVRLRTALVALTVTAASVGTVAVAGPANATTTSCTTATTIKVSDIGRSGHVATYGDTLSIHVDVTGSCADDTSLTMPLAGNVTLYRSINGGSYTPIKSSPAGESWMYTDFTAYKNVSYGAIFNSGSDSTHTWQSSQSPTAPRFAVIRKTGYPASKSVHGGARVNYAIKPAASIRGLMVKFQVRKNGHWRAYKRIRARANGHVIGVFRGARGKGIRYRMILPAKRSMTASSTQFKITTYLY